MTVAGGTRRSFLYYGDTLVGFKLGNDTYYYLRNLQGDIVQIVDANGTVVVSYRCDDWGKPVSITGSAAATVGVQNPFRYRGYFYDNESGLYYLNSRYYDPETGRFVSADAYVSTGQGVTGFNMFAYCLNNPVNMSDSAGNWPRWITAVIAIIETIVAITLAPVPVAASTSAKKAICGIALYAAQTLHYDARQEKNNPPLTYDEAMNTQGADDSIDAACHQFTATDMPNKKVCWPDGTEGIYDSSGKLVTDSRDIGTYNFSVPNGGWSNIWHGVFDVAPWIIFGNDDDDTTWMYQRMGALIKGGIQ